MYLRRLLLGPVLPQIVHGQCFPSGTNNTTDLTLETTGDMLRLNMAGDVTSLGGAKGTLKAIPDARFILLYLLVNQGIQT